MNRVTLPVAATILALPLPALAFTALFLQDSPIANFTAEDNQLLITNFRDAMDNNSDGEVTAWNNETSGVHGTITPTSTVEADGQTCRNVQIENTAVGQTARSTYRFCKSAEKDWHVVQQ